MTPGWRPRPWPTCWISRTAGTGGSCWCWRTSSCSSMNSWAKGTPGPSGRCCSTNARIMVLASAMTAFAGLRRPDAALYELFLLQSLEPLDRKECLDLWRDHHRLGDSRTAPAGPGDPHGRESPAAHALGRRRIRERPAGARPGGGPARRAHGLPEAHHRDPARPGAQGLREPGPDLGASPRCPGGQGGEAGDERRQRPAHPAGEPRFRAFPPAGARQALPPNG